jgi:O-antigen/teichoic acid export membrane protein
MLVFLVNAAGAAAAVTSYVVLARVMPLAEFGTYALASAWIGLAATGLTGGMQLGVIRLIAVYRKEGDEGRAIAVWSLAHRASIVTLAAAALMAFVIYALARPEGVTTTGLVVATLQTAVIGLTRLYAAAGRAFGAVLVPQAADILIRDAPTGALALAWVLTAPSPLDATSALTVTLVAATIAAIIGGWAVAASALRETRPVRPSTSEMRDWARTTTPLLGISLLQMWLARAELVMLGILNRA